MRRDLADAPPAAERSARIERGLGSASFPLRFGCECLFVVPGEATEKSLPSAEVASSKGVTIGKAGLSGLLLSRIG